MQNKVLNEVAIEQMDDLIKAVKGGSSGFDADGTLPELQDGEVTDPLMAVGNDGKAKKLPVKTLFGKHNIRGSGNIDLYRHEINLFDGKVSYLFYIYSSDSFQFDSLTDLKTVLGSTFNIPIAGYHVDNNYSELGLNANYIDGLITLKNGTVTVHGWSSITISDTVTTI